MERNISPAGILCIVLVSLAAVIGLGYGAFAITKGSANDGTQDMVSQTSYASNSWKDDYDAKDVTGAQVQALLKEADSKGIAVFLNTRGMCQSTISVPAEVPVLRHNGKYYMNYGTVFDYEDDSYKKTSGDVTMSDNSGLLGVRDGSSLKIDYSSKFDGGKIVRHSDYTGVYANGAVNFVDTHAKFRSNLIYGNDGEVAGVILSQVNRAGTTMAVSTGGFSNGSGAMGGTSGTYIPSHSGGGNIPLSSGGNSYAPSKGGANASGPSTKPSTPVPEKASGEHLITFDTRGGSTIDYVKVATGGKLQKPLAPTRVGYGFAGWYTDSSCTTKYNFSRVVNSDITLYARWFLWGDPNNDGKLTQADADMILDYEASWNISIPFYLSSFTETLKDPGYGPTSMDALNILERVEGIVSKMPIDTETAGYEFDLENGYYYDRQGNRSNIPIQIPMDKVGVTFLSNYGPVYQTVYFASGEKVVKPAIPVRNGYSFAGWYTDSTYNNKFDFNTPVTSYTNLYARWVLWGDVNQDGNFTEADRDMLRQYTVGGYGVILLNPLTCYVSGLNDAIGNNDIIFMNQRLGGTIDKLPIETELANCELNLEDWVYYTPTGETKPLPNDAKPPEIISFSFYNVDTGTTSTMYAEKESTWDKWVDSGYNTIGAVKNSGNVIVGNKTICVSDTYACVDLSSIVVSGNYCLSNYDIAFANNSWDKIIEVAHANVVPGTWKVGDKKVMTINGKDYNVQIIGKYHDTYTGGGIAPMTFQLVECYASAPMNTVQTNTCGWTDSELRTVHMVNYFNALPPEIQAGIRAVDKQTIKGGGRGAVQGVSGTTIEITSDKLFVLSEKEFNNTVKWSGVSEGAYYEFYKNGGSKAKKLNGAATIQWLRTPEKGRNYYFVGVDTNGSLGTGYSHNKFSIPFAFCF